MLMPIGPQALPELASGLAIGAVTATGRSCPSLIWKRVFRSLTTMRNAIRLFLNLSYTPTWTELIAEFAGSTVAFALILAALALGRGQP
jgi:hypothetical protein